ncbi:unnamed protein product [Alopecurus aequalis]
MGSCASVHKDDVGLPQKQLLSSSPPPPKEGFVDGKGGAAVGDVLVDLRRKIEEQGGFKTHDSGSKDEMFFESQGWLESDCDDDFHSVNGDFTPSRGNTPNYQPRANTVMSNIFLPNNVQDSKSSEPSPTGPSEPSPSGRRKLAELLQEAMQNGREESTATGEADSSKNGDQQVAAAGKPVSEPSSSCSTEATPMREARSRKERSWYTGGCCLPPFVHSLTLEDEGRQKTGPGPVAV